MIKTAEKWKQGLQQRTFARKGRTVEADTSPQAKRVQMDQPLQANTAQKCCSDRMICGACARCAAQWSTGKKKYNRIRAFARVQPASPNWQMEKIVKHVTYQPYLARCTQTHGTSHAPVACCRPVHVRACCWVISWCARACDRRGIHCSRPTASCPSRLKCKIVSWTWNWSFLLSQSRDLLEVGLSTMYRLSGSEVTPSLHHSPVY